MAVKPQDSDWAEVFLMPEDLEPIVGMLMLLDRYDVGKAKRLARFAANVRFQAACLDNVRDGLMFLDLDSDGTPTFMLTGRGEVQAFVERRGLQGQALRALLPDQESEAKG